LLDLVAEEDWLAQELKTAAARSKSKRRCMRGIIYAIRVTSKAEFFPAGNRSPKAIRGRR